MKTQTWLSCYYKFISVENITLLSISSDDFLYALLEVAEQQMWNYSSYVNKKRIKFPDEGMQTQTGCLLMGIREFHSINIGIFRKKKIYLEFNPNFFLRECKCIILD